MITKLFSAPGSSDVVTATIAKDASLSDAIPLKGYRYAAVVIPAQWTTANLTFQGSMDGTNFFNLYDSAGAEMTANAAASECVSLADKLAPLCYVKIRSGTASSAVTQAAARTLTISLK